LKKSPLKKTQKRVRECGKMGQNKIRENWGTWDELWVNLGEVVEPKKFSKASIRFCFFPSGEACMSARVLAVQPPKPELFCD
jgi:hypothetical protein